MDIVFRSALVAGVAEPRSPTGRRIIDTEGLVLAPGYFNLTVPETLKTWTALETVLSVSGFGVAALLMAVV